MGVFPTLENRTTYQDNGGHGMTVTLGDVAPKASWSSSLTRAAGPTYMASPSGIDPRRRAYLIGFCNLAPSTFCAVDAYCGFAHNPLVA
jgi:hypothetical protein